MDVNLQHPFWRNKVAIAEKRARSFGEPCVLWLDDHGSPRYARLSWYEQTAEGAAFCEPDQVVTIVD